MIGPAEIIDLLGLEPLAGEGGMWTQTYVDEQSTAIYFLVQPGDFSALHRLTGPEMYHFYVGAPLHMLLLHPDGRIHEPLLGPDLASGQRPQVMVPAGVWQGSSTTGAWTLLGTTMAPAFDPGGFELGERATLAGAYPRASARIIELTRHSKPQRARANRARAS
jgi:uncharacterized protein